MSGAPLNRERSRLLWRAAAWLVLAALLGLGLIGWMHPDMRLAWATVAAMCGF